VNKGWLAKQREAKRRRLYQEWEQRLVENIIMSLMFRNLTLEQGRRYFDVVDFLPISRANKQHLRDFITSRIRLRGGG